jgi:hypothetical protein
VISAPIGLLGPEASLGETSGAQVQASYLHLVSAHLNAIAQAPGTTPEQRRLAAQINTGIKNVDNWLAKVRVDARQLLFLTDAQLLSREGLSVLNDMVTQAFYAYVGRLDPTTNQVQAGAVQVNYDIEHLATFEIKPYTST